MIGEGVRDAREAADRALRARGRNPQTFETGIKEIWRIDPKHRPGRVVHGLAFPVFLNGFHGMWLYDMKDNLISYGYGTVLESHNPHCDSHLEAQKFKTNPWMRWLLEGAELVRYGAKAIPTGGLYSQPKLYVDGALLVGDSASFCNAQNLAGIHMAMKTGMMAADTIIDALQKQDFSSKTLGAYTERYRRSWAYDEHYQARNFAPSVQKGVFFFGLNEPFRTILTNGRGLMDNMTIDAGHTHMRRLWELPERERTKEKFEFDGKLTFSKEHLVQFSGTSTRWISPRTRSSRHRSVPRRRSEEYGNPAELSARPPLRDGPRRGSPRKKKLFIHHENCVH